MSEWRSTKSDKPEKDQWVIVWNKCDSKPITIGWFYGADAYYKWWMEAPEPPIEREYLTYDKVVIGIKEGRIFSKEEWNHEDATVSNKDTRHYITVKSQMEDDWYEVK